MNNPDHLRPLFHNQTVILLAEDDVLVQNVARIALEFAGYFILTADNGEEALAISEKYPGSIDLLVSDIQMPLMDGLELKRRIQIERPSTKVLLMSGNTSQVPDCPFLEKPFTPDLLRRKVRQMIENPVLLPVVRDVRQRDTDPAA